MQRDNLDLPVPPYAARVFFGLRAVPLTEVEGDSAEERADKRRRFFNDLGSTFMPGTPLMQAPMALSAYCPAVIDPPAGAAVPDEVAIIVYASREDYAYFRSNSLARRMYTKSHWAVFDMDRSMAVFPESVDAPATGDYEGGQARIAYMNDVATDWQSGYTRVLLVVAGEAGAAFADDVLARIVAARGTAGEHGIDQVIVGVTENFAALWLHSSAPQDDPAGKLDLLPAGATVMRELDAQPAFVNGDREKGVTIDGPCAYTFRFARYMEFFDDRPKPEA